MSQLKQQWFVYIFWNVTEKRTHLSGLFPQEWMTKSLKKCKTKHKKTTTKKAVARESEY